MTDRGEYRGILVALVDGPDYQALTPNAKLVLLTLKIPLGPFQIDVTPALQATLHERTGLTLQEVATALTELELGQWIQRERNVVWVVKGLRYEQSIRSTTPNHRKSAQNHVAGLPRLAIVRRFMEFYPDWFPKGPGEEYPADTISEPMPIVSPNPSASLKTEDGRLNTENSSAPQNGAGTPKGDSSWSREAIAMLHHTGNQTRGGHVAGALKPLVETRGWSEEVRERWRFFCEFGRHYADDGRWLSTPRPVKDLRPQRFVDGYDQWNPRAPPSEGVGP